MHVKDGLLTTNVQVGRCWSGVLSIFLKFLFSLWILIQKFDITVQQCVLLGDCRFYNIENCTKIVGGEHEKQRNIHKERLTRHPANISTSMVAEHQLNYLTLLSCKLLPGCGWGAAWAIRGAKDCYHWCVTWEGSCGNIKWWVLPNNSLLDCNLALEISEGPWQSLVAHGFFCLAWIHWESSVQFRHCSLIFI